MGRGKSWLARADRLLAELHDPGREEVWIDAANLPLPPPVIELDELVMEKGEHSYDSWRTDKIGVDLTERAAGQLGLLVLADLVHGPKRGIDVALTHRRSEIRLFHIEAWDHGRRGQHRDGLRLAPTGFSYVREEAERHPWTGRFSRTVPLPKFDLTNQERCVVNWADRDVLDGCGPLLAAGLFAQLLLDLSQPDQPCREVDLEGEAGFGSLAPTSVEIGLDLPGSIGWRDPRRS